MRRPVPLLALPLMAACTQPPQYVAPAPAGAVECALREAIDLGYRRMEGAADDPVVRVSQRPDDPPGAGGASLDPPPGTGRPEGSPTRTPMPAADAHARRILATCSTP